VDCIEDSVIDGRIIMKWFLNNENEILGVGFIWLRAWKTSGLFVGRKRTSR
jgi:hypothetical protein